MFYKSLIFALICSSLSPVLTIPTQSAEDVNQMYDIEVVTLPSELNSTLSTALVTIASIINSSTSLESSLNYDFYPTVHSALMAPFTLFAGLFNEIFKFYDQRSIFKVLSLSNLKSALMSMPSQLVRYWNRLVEMEMECIFRTICDLSAYLSPRMPSPFQQILGVYFTTHSAESTYFRAVANGMINHNCVNYYPKCSPMEFFNRLASDAKNVATTTMNPIAAQVLEAIRRNS